MVRTRPLPLDFPCLGLGNLVVSQPSCLRVSWELGTESVLQLNELNQYQLGLFQPDRLHILALPPVPFRLSLLADHLSEKNVTRTDVVPTSSAATLLSTSTTNNSSTDNSNREPAKTLTAHFPDLCARPDGTSFCLDLTKRFLLPATVGAKPWDRHLHLTDVIVMLVNQTGRIVYHKCHFSGASPLPQDPLHYFHHKSWDDFVHPTYADLWSRHQTKALEEARLVHPNNVVSSSDGLSHPDIPTSSAGGVEEDASVRILDCPDYRVQFGNQSFSVHTFSLPASRELPRGVATWTSVHVDGAAGENGSPDIFVVHYHRLYRYFNRGNHLAPSTTMARPCSVHAETPTVMIVVLCVSFKMVETAGWT
ncbi:hypothetical protein T265_04460 [Opisthorchis viverrini]|uniref:Uncharacterized protein n=1 Tax=Opisthorchis viverrini TaxID=6198 RepID=A0A074ZSG7_OPIVI|nr:hypothetical protein T265_04460 [Opisthorchis viverrini]KER28767.1 hypothetical protein T265_04460 [Opisthorchis viverrini]